KKDKNRVFVVNLKHDGIFSPYPFSYIHGDEKKLTDFDFEAEFTIWASTRVECGTAYVQTQESITQPSVAATETTPRGKTIEADAVEPQKLKPQGMKRKVAEPSAAEPPFRIYHMNRGRSERIFN
nr:zinc finger, PMZ-type [Tanacetum cinerariifolium]